MPHIGTKQSWLLPLLPCFESDTRRRTEEKPDARYPVSDTGISQNCLCREPGRTLSPVSWRKVWRCFRVEKLTHWKHWWSLGDSNLGPLQCRRRRALTAPTASKASFMIDRAPEIAELAVELRERLIQIPAPLRIAAQMRDASFADLGGECRAKPVPPEPDGLELTSGPRSAKRSSMLHNDSGYFTYIITTVR